jgi:outer membrane murein-binding lipoprotein Lpp
MAAGTEVKTWAVIIATTIAVGSAAWGLGRGGNDSLKTCVDTLEADVTQLKVDSAKVETKLDLLQQIMLRLETKIDKIDRSTTP